MWHLVAGKAAPSCICSWMWEHGTGQIKDRSQALVRPPSRTVGQGAHACSPVMCGSLGNQAGLCPVESSLHGGLGAGACSPSAPGIIRTSERTALTQS